MKKTCAFLLILALLLSCVSTHAETYSVDLLETQLTLPRGMTVFHDNSGEESVDILFSLNGREDVAFETAFTYAEAYEEYCNGDLPQEALDALNGYYTGLILGGMGAFETVPFFADPGQDGAELNPFLLCGRDENGNAVCLQLMVIQGFVMTVSAVGTAPTFDDETMEAYYSLFENVVAMIADETPESLKKGLPSISAWREQVAALIQSALRPSASGSSLLGIVLQPYVPAGQTGSAGNGPAVIGGSSASGNNGSSGSGVSSDGPILIYSTSGGSGGSGGYYDDDDDWYYGDSCGIPWFMEDYYYYYCDDDWYDDDDDWYDDWYDDDDYYYYGYCYPYDGCW